MQPFTRLEAIAAPLPRANVDTDMIVRVERLVALRRGAFGPYAFESLRYHADGTENDAFILNQAGYRAAQILVAGPNFGCGSSRESAVWSLWDFGIRCIIAPSFGEIFENNCIQNGLLPITLPHEIVADLAAAIAPGSNTPHLAVDLGARTVTRAGAAPISFAIDDRSRAALLNGWDAIALTQRDEAEIAAFQARDRASRPWIYRF
ncbi:3-isopropylmalate dehydratase small subunit [bacterium YEK0313]|nr:3-isopropylmalate dehydratase small subunit [bacterium YEK0313]